MTYKYSDCHNALIIGEGNVCPKCSEYCTPMVECPFCKGRDTNKPNIPGGCIWPCMVCGGNGKIAISQYNKQVRWWNFFSASFIGKQGNHSHWSNRKGANVV